MTLSPVPGARRELYVELTETGKSYADQILKSVYEAEEQLFQLYFRDHDMAFVKSLNDFSNAMKQFFSTGRYDCNPETSNDSPCSSSSDDLH